MILLFLWFDPVCRIIIYLNSLWKLHNKSDLIALHYMSTLRKIPLCRALSSTNMNCFNGFYLYDLIILTQTQLHQQL